MKKNYLKKMVASVLTVCLIGAFGLSYVTATDTDSPFVDEVKPNTMYLQSGGISYNHLNSNTMRVSITTKANTYATSLYHDIVIYKNGVLVYSDRAYGSNSTRLRTNLDFSASSGDFFSTYVTHYVSHNGYTEHCDTHEDSYF